MGLSSKRFDIRRELGGGGMGVVYEAYDRVLNTTVAIKTIRAGDPEHLLRLKREFRALQDLRHPNLVNIGELFEEDGGWFMTMDLVQGVDFIRYVRPGPSSSLSYERIALAATSPVVDQGSGPVVAREGRGTLDLQRLRSCLAQLTDALCYLHGRGKLHRDVKPGNVLVTDEGRVVLLDFGLVADASPNPAWSGGQVIGTVAYMAPEQAMGGPVGVEADWYAVGVILHEALTGQLPFAGSAMEMLMQKQAGEPPPPASLAPGIPADLDALCRSLLRAEPHRRMRGEEVRHRLLGAAHGPDVMPITTTTQGVRPFVGREEHLRFLRIAFDDAFERQPIGVVVYGESGVGKSALVSHFADAMIEERQAVVLAGRCYEREYVPYKAVDGIIDVLARHLQRLPREEVAALVPRRASLLLQVFPALRKVPSLAEAPHHDVADPQELRTRLFAALRELFGLLCERRPVLVIVDDMQWADEDSRALLAELVRPPDAPPFLLLATWRQASGDEAPAELGPALACEQRSLRVERLTPEESRHLAALMMERADGGQPAAERGERAEAIARDSRGNPLFIEELVRYAALHGARGRPALFDEVLRERVAALDEPLRQLLQLLAVAGSPTEHESVAQAAGLDLAEVMRLVAWLRAANLVRTTGGRATDRVDTFHDRVREAVLASLTSEERRQHHRSLAMALEASGRTDPVTIAAHYRAAGDKARAVHFGVKAATKTAAALAFDQAAWMYRQVLDLLPAPGVDRRPLLVALGDVLAFGGRGAEAAKAYDAAAEGATAGEALDLRRKGAQQLLMTGHIDEGLRALNAVLASQGLAYPRTPLRALASVLARRLQLRLRGLTFVRRDESEVTARELARVDVCWIAGMGLATVDTIRGNSFMTRGLLLALRAGEPGRIARALAVEAGFLSTTGIPARAKVERMLGEADRLAGEVGNLHAQLLALGARGQAHYLRGEFAEARRLSEEAEAAFRERCVGVAWEVNTTRLWATRSLTHLGEFRLLARRVPEQLHECQERGDLYGSVSLRASIVPIIRLVDDKPEQAAAEVTAAEAAWTTAGFHIQHYYAWSSRVAVALYAGRVDEAHSQATELQRRLQRSLIARIQFTRLSTQDLLGRTALAAAVKASGSAREAALREAEGCARRVETEQAPWALALATALRAGVGMVRLDRPEADEVLERAIDRFEALDMAFHARAARRWLALLAGDDQGKRTAKECEAWMREQGVRSCARLTALYFPAAALLP
jgi:serine/threonine protein kinase